MTFATKEFAIFISIIFLIWNVLPVNKRWIILFPANVYFCYRAGIQCLIFILSVGVITYFMAMIVDKIASAKVKKVVIWLEVAIFTGMLVLVRTVFSGIVVPLGLSFYSLMCMSYCIDVYRGMYGYEKNIYKLITFVSYFPHVIQGPFNNYGVMKDTLFSPKTFDYNRCVHAMYRISFGLMKKIVLADRISIIIEDVYAHPSGYYGFTVLFTAVMYSIQLYADFSGYMDIAMGVSKLLGIEMEENFNTPYFSKSMAEFWRRWHITLGGWFKNYVFYPVQKTSVCNSIRKTMKKKNNKYGMNVIPAVIGLFFVWTLIGLWHGFDWNYLCFDWMCGCIIIFSELMKPVYNKINSLGSIFKSKLFDCFRMIRTFALITFCFMIFRPSTLNDSAILISNMFKGVNFYAFAEFVYWHLYDVFLIAPALIVMIMVDVLKNKGIDVSAKLHKMNPVVRYLIYAIGIVYIYLARYEFGTVGFAYSVF